MADPYNAVRINGTMVGGEVWSVNPKFGDQLGDGISEYSDLVEWVNAIALLNGGNMVPGSWLGAISNLAPITSVRAEYYGADGKLAQSAERVFTTPIPGTSGPTKPYQTAVVLSLLTGRPGRSYRGRLYLPALALPISPADLRVSLANITSLANDTAAFLRQIANASPEPASLDPVVVSQTKGTHTAVTAVAVGDILDVQRRRRDAVQERYFSAGVAP